MAGKVRLTYSVEPDINERLDHAAAVAGKRPGPFLEKFLDEKLPSRAELAELITSGAADADAG